MRGVWCRNGLRKQLFVNLSVVMDIDSMQDLVVDEDNCMELIINDCDMNHSDTNNLYPKTLSVTIHVSTKSDGIAGVFVDHHAPSAIIVRHGDV